MDSTVEVEPILDTKNELGLKYTNFYGAEQKLYFTLILLTFFH